MCANQTAERPKNRYRHTIYHTSSRNTGENQRTGERLQIALSDGFGGMHIPSREQNERETTLDRETIQHATKGRTVASENDQIDPAARCRLRTVMASLLRAGSSN